MIQQSSKMESVAKRFEKFFFYIKKWSEQKVKWLDEMIALCDKTKHVKCPVCGKETLDYGFILVDKEENLGWAAIWCNNCHKGKIVSRCKPMENSKFITDIPHNIDYC